MTMNPDHSGLGRALAVPATSGRAGVAVERVRLVDRAARMRFVRAGEALRATHAVFRPSARHDEAFRIDPTEAPGAGCQHVLGLLAHRAGRVVGRLVALRPVDGGETGWFARFDFDGDPDVADALFREGARWVRRGGAVRWMGPVGLVPGEGCGVLVDGRVGRTVGDLAYHPPEHARWLGLGGWRGASEAGVWRIAVRTSPGSHTDPARAGLEVVPVSLKAPAESLDDAGWAAFLAALPRNTDPLVRLRCGATELRHELLRTAAEGGICFVRRRGRVVGLGVLRPHCACASGTRLPGWIGRLRAWKQRRITRVGGLRIWRIAEGRTDPEPTEVLLDALVERAERLGFRELLVGPIPDDASGTIAAVRARGGRIDRRYRVFAQAIG